MLPRRLHRDERGAFLVVWALLLVAMLTMVAIVLDLGRLRDTRRRTQRTADLAAIAAGQDIAGGSIVNACKAAIKYVRTNTLDISGLTETCGSTFAAACNPSAPIEMVRPAGPYVVTIRSPIPDSEILEPSYTLGVTAADGLPCERMRVTVQRTNTSLFAGVVGISNLQTKGTAVVRGFVGKNPKQNAGLVVLERKGCGVIETGGGGASKASVLVKGSIASDGTPRPGTIHIDTKALEASSGGDCTTGGDTPSKYAVFGSKLVPSADRPNKPSIEAESIGGAPGRLDMYALTVDRNNIHTAYDVTGGGVSPAATPGVVASRTIVDDVYNAPIGGGPGRVTKLKTDSNALLTSLRNAVTTCPACNVVPAPSVSTPPCSAPNFYVYPPGSPGGPDPNGCPPLVVPAGSGPPACSNTSATLVDVPAAYDKVYLNCPSGLSVKAIRLQGTKFVLAGKLDIGSGNSALFPNAQELVVGGCGACTGGDKVGINVAGALVVNSGPTTPLVKECDDNLDNDGDGKTDEFDPLTATGDTGCQSVVGWDEINCVTDRDGPGVRPNRLVLATGPIETSSSSVVELCQTFVLLADGANLPDQDVSAASDDTCDGYTNTDGVFVPQPCPKNNSSGGGAYKGYLSLKGDIDWSAPAQTSGLRDTSQPLQSFEDLALWTETSAPSEIGGAGATFTSGVFFFPNARTTFSGQASQSIDQNAQYIARRLLVSGQGTLVMRPNPNDVVETPAPYFRLIR